MSANRWFATGNFFTSYRQEQRLFKTHLDRLFFVFFLVSLFVWPLFLAASNKNMLVINNILIAVVAVYGLNLVTGFAGLISTGQREGSIRADVDPQTAAWALISLAVGILLQGVVDPAAADWQAVTLHSVEMLINGMKQE